MTLESSPLARRIAAAQRTTLPARLHDADFPQGHGNFESLNLASDGKLRCIIASHQLDVHGQIFQFDPAADELTHVADLGVAVGEENLRAIPQGKGHVPFFEHGGKLYSATHVGFYKPPAFEGDAIELIGRVEGYAPYPGGHFFSYDLRTGAFESLAQAPEEEGIITMMMDPERGRLFGLTWPGGLFLVYDMQTATLRNLGPVFGKGEAGDFERGEWRLICRNFALDPRDGNLYWTRARGELLCFDFEADTVRVMDDCNLRQREFGALSDHSLWRAIIWHGQEQVFYGVHYRQNYLFRFDPRARTVEPLVRIAAEPFNDPATHTELDYLPFRIHHWYWGTLAFKLGPDGETIYYLASGPPAPEERFQGFGTTRLITYHIPTGEYRDHGTPRLPDGRYPSDPQCIEIANGRIFSVQNIELPDDDQSPRTRRFREGWMKKDKPYPEETNLVSFPDPLAPA
jgi:hypothetical protein